MRSTQHPTHFSTVNTRLFFCTDETNPIVTFVNLTTHLNNTTIILYRPGPLKQAAQPPSGGLAFSERRFSVALVAFARHDDPCPLFDAARHLPYAPPQASGREASTLARWQSLSASKIRMGVWMAILGIAVQGLVAGLLVAVLVNLANNLRCLQPLQAWPPSADQPLVSILVPARNEEDNIEVCVRSLLAQGYPRFEVLVLDDHSEDDTPARLLALVRKEPRLRFLRSRPLPRGWVGKSWACHQLAQAAQGELLLFTDADTRHHPATLTSAVAMLQDLQLDLLTVCPRQEVRTWAERLLVPILTWSFVLFLPLPLAYRARNPDLCMATGQFMLFRRQAYRRIGGHAAVRGDPIEDLALVRKIKTRGLRWRLADGCERIACRMYGGTRQVVEGLSKNLLPGFQYRLSLFLFTLLVIALALVQPPVVLLLHAAGARLPGPTLALAVVEVGLALGIAGVAYPRFRLPAYLALLFPITALATIAIGICSLVRALAGSNSWKGRPLPEARLRLW